MLDLEEIKTAALEAHRSGKPWHFHILSPNCVFNTKQQFAFVLELPSEGLGWTHYSDLAEKTLGQELSPLLHGAKVMDKSSTDTGYKPSAEVTAMAEAAATWNEHDIAWHHHLLFPDCMFNQHAPKYTLMLENNDGSSRFESVTDEEPGNDLKQIESLFYKN